MTRNGKTRAPSHLRAPTRRWFDEVMDTFALESHHVRLLLLAAQSWDRAERAREVLDGDGVTYLDRFKAPRARPEVAIERDSRIAYIRAMRELALDVAAPDESPRPPRITRGAR